ncbi:MAG TPA: hypothetical protein GXZ53_02690 [Firmicutes bacterium]|nr:hypothetical protein [Bacillota bacterium]
MGSAAAGAATNTGEGPFIQEERDAAKYLIYQYNRGDWGGQNSGYHQPMRHCGNSTRPGCLRRCGARPVCR